MLDNWLEVKRIQRNYQRRLNRLRIKARSGDNIAARKLMVSLAEEHQAIKALGYRFTDENEPGRPGRLVKRTQEWIDEQVAKETVEDKMRRKIRQALINGDSNVDTLIRNYISSLANGYDQC